MTGADARQDEVSKLYCIVRTTKKGGHASCAATGSSENCHGVLKVYKYRGPSLPDWLAENPRLKRFMSRVEQDYGSTPKMATATQTSDLLPPGNLSAPDQSRFQSMKHAAENVGAAIGRFAQTTYRCLRSFFRHCSREAQE